MNTTISLLLRTLLHRGLAFATLLSSLLLLQGCEKEDPRTGNIYRGGSRSTCFPPELENGLIAFYPFENGSLLDQSGNTNDLINPTGALTIEDRSGNPGCAYEFVMANDEYLVCENPTFLNGMSQISISLWYQSSPLGDPGNMEAILMRGDSGGHCPNTMSEWSLGIFDCRQAVFGYADASIWHESSPSIFTLYTTCGDVSDYLNSTWHHLVAIYDNGNYEIWMDGQLSVDIASTPGGCPNPEVMEDIGDFYIGKTFGGKVDDLAIYDRVLSAGEIAQLYGLAPCCQN